MTKAAALTSDPSDAALHVAGGAPTAQRTRRSA